MAKNLLGTSLPLKRTAEVESRIADYINDKIQSPEDLHGIDALVQNVTAQQELLRKQLLEAQQRRTDIQYAQEVRSAELKERIAAFQRQQKDIDRRLMIITQSDVSDEAFRKFSGHMKKLQQLDVATSYCDLLAEVERLNSNARRHFQKSPQDGLRPYLQLRRLSKKIKDAQPLAEGAAPYLIEYVENSTRELWQHMRDAFVAEFEKTLEKMGWPNKAQDLSDSLLEEWSNGVNKLLALQKPELTELESHEDSSTRQHKFLILLPLEVMAKPLRLRFDYHFSGDRPTNRPDEPNRFLAFVLDLLNKYDAFFAYYLQPLLRDNFRSSNIGMNPLYIDSSSALIHALLPMPRGKIGHLLPVISDRPQLLALLVQELITFDTTLRDGWNYDGGFSSESWPGLAGELLERKSVFNEWLQFEKRIAMKRYEDIVSRTENHEIDYDSVDRGVTKPTKAAIMVEVLLERITGLYRPLQAFSQKLQFLIDVQICIFDKYHEVLYSSLEAYISISSAIARTVQGISREEQEKAQGSAGIRRLCRIYGSSEYLERRMRDWSDDVFFLELWDELQYRAKNSAKSPKNFAGSMSVNDVAERTSSDVLSSSSGQQMEEDGDLGSGPGGALFDETSGAYHRLRLRTEQLLQDAVIRDIRESLRPYGRTNSWSDLMPDDGDTNATTAGAGAASDSAQSAILNSHFSSTLPASPSTELDGSLRQLTTYLSLLSSVLGNAALRKIARALALAVQNFIWDNVLLRGNFSTLGAAQLRRDVLAIWAVFDRFVGSDGNASLGRVSSSKVGGGGGGVEVGQAAFWMRRLREGVELLGMPIRPGKDGNKDRKSRAGNAQTDDIGDNEDGWDAWDGDGDAEDGDASTDNGSPKNEDDSGSAEKMGIWEVEKRIFRDNESAREVLEELGFEVLTESEARHVLERRIELAS